MGGGSHFTATVGLKKLHIYIIKTFVPLLLGSFAVTWFIVVMQLLWRFVGDIVGKGVEPLVLLKLMFYASMTVVNVALVLAVLIAALMTFGNLGERLELLAMKSAGISLVRIFKPLFFFITAVALGLFIFQNDLMITSQVKFWQYYFSIKNKSPELAIPAGVFYKDIEGYSIYVEEKNNDTQMLHGVMIYDYKDGFQNANIITADSGKLYTTNDGAIFVLELYNGESFRNLRQSSDPYATGSAMIPYMREAYSSMEIRIPFDASLDMVDQGMLSSQFVGKNMFELKDYTDSLSVQLDSVAKVNTRIVMSNSYMSRLQGAGREATINTKAPDAPASLEQESSGVSRVNRKAPNLYAGLTEDVQKQYDMDKALANVGMQELKRIHQNAISVITTKQNDIYFSNITQAEMQDLKNKNEFEYWRKYTYPVAVIVFFLIGAPLGSLIRKGGLGVPFIVGVLFFIVFYILESTGMKTAREGRMEVWIGMWLPNMVLLPIGLWLNYVATKDSTRLNLDTYLNWFRRVMGMNTTRKVGYKTQVQQSADLFEARDNINSIRDLADEVYRHGIRRYYDYYMKEDEMAPYRQRLDDLLNSQVQNLENARDYLLVHRTGSYPYLHSLGYVYMPGNKWYRLALMIIFPAGLLLYAYYVIRYRAYLKELKALKYTNDQVSEEIERVLKRGTMVTE